MDSLWQGLWDFLSFRTLISPTVLIGFYLLGAVVMPLFAFLLWLKLRARFAVVRNSEAAVGRWSKRNLSPPQRIGLLLAALIAFLLMEMFWRMLFEFLIAYLHMAEDLQRLVARTHS